MLFAKTGNEDILADLITAIINPKTPIISLTVLNPEIQKDELNDKGIVLDIAIELESGGRINIEMQVNRQPYLFKRAYFYASKLFTSQLAKGEPYSSLGKCISIFLMKDQVFFNTPPKSFHYIFEMKEREQQADIESLLEIQFIEITKIFNYLGPIVEQSGKLPLIDWCQFLYDPRNQTTRGKGERHMSAIDKARRALEELSNDPEAQELARMREKALRDYESNMAAYREEGWTEGRKEGLKVGLEEGWNRGKEAGRKEEQLQTLRQLLFDPATKELPLEKLCEFTRLSPEEIKKHIELWKLKG